MSQMTMALHTLSSPNASFLIPKKSTPPPSSISPLATRFRRRELPFHSPLTALRLVNPVPACYFSRRRPELLYGRDVRVCAGEENSDRGNGGDDNGDSEYRGESTLPERFRPLTKEAPEPPLRWPWFVAAGFLLYAWRAVLFELLNWKKALMALFGFAGDLSKLVLALILQVIGRPITSLIYCVETALYTIRAFYSGIVAYTPVPELTFIIILSSAVLAIAEATVPDSVTSQSYALTISGLTAYATLTNNVSVLFLWTVLLSLYGFSRLIRKRDDVTSALPVAAVLVAVGNTWVRILAIASYLALAIYQHSEKSREGKEESAVATDRKLPLPLFLAALAIGIRVAAKWAGYRHLTWKIV